VDGIVQPVPEKKLQKLQDNEGQDTEMQYSDSLEPPQHHQWSLQHHVQHDCDFVPNANDTVPPIDKQDGQHRVSAKSATTHSEVRPPPTRKCRSSEKLAVTTTLAWHSKVTIQTSNLREMNPPI
jgi:hypothetical protein